jgi:hypothetical protein
LAAVLPCLIPFQRTAIQSKVRVPIPLKVLAHMQWELGQGRLQTDLIQCDPLQTNLDKTPLQAMGTQTLILNHNPRLHLLTMNRGNDEQFNGIL